MTFHLTGIREVLFERQGFNKHNLTNDYIYGLNEKHKELRQKVADFVKKHVDKSKEKFVAFLESSKSDKNKDNKEKAEEKINEDKEMEAFEIEKREILREMGKFGLLGIRVKKDYGGPEGELIDCVIVQEELAQICIVTALSCDLHDNYCVHAIDTFGTEEQKRKYLPKMCSGEILGISIVPMPEDQLTSGLMQLEAIKRGNYYILNGAGIGSFNEYIDDFVIAFAITNHDIEYGVTPFIVEKSFKGFSFSKAAKGYVFLNCKVPAKNIIGENCRERDVFFSCVTIEKLVLAGGVVGFMQTFCDIAFQCAHTSDKFDEFKSLLAGMYTKLCSSRSYLYTVVRSYNNDYIIPKDCAAAFLYCAKKTARSAVQVEEILVKTGSYELNIHVIRQLMDFLETYQNHSVAKGTENSIVTILIYFENE